MRAIIMAGGFGTRLKPLTNDIPKPMVPIIDKPIMAYILELLRSHGFTDIAVALGHMPEVIMDYFGDGQESGVKLTYFIEEEPLGTAGCVKNAGEFLLKDTRQISIQKQDAFVQDNPQTKSFLVVSGDAFTNIDLSALRDFHLENNAIFTLAAKYVDDVTGFGVLDVDENGQITQFVEKPEGAKEGLVNTGIYMIRGDVLSSIPDGYFDFGKNLLPTLIGKDLYAYKTNAYWSDVGNLPSYYLTNYFVATNANYRLV